MLIFLFTTPLYADESVFDSIEADDEEIELAEDYIHQGKADAQTLETCTEGVNGYSDICTEESSAFKGGSMKTLEVMLPALTAAYSMFNSAVSAQGGGLTKTYYKEVDGVSEVDTSKGTDGQEDAPDYCAYIGLAGEAASTAYTTIQNNQTEQTYISETAEATQAATFYALADSHKTLKKASTVQTAIWGATAACYVAYATQASYTGDWKVWAKMAAATFIALYYKKKADAHAERYAILKQMAKDLPQAGECNPYTQKSCFCAEDTSATSDPVNYNKYCEPSVLSSETTSEESYAYVCTDSSGNADDDCSCKTTGTCISTKVVAATNLGLDPTALKSALSAIKPITSGFADASLASASANNSALVDKALDSYKPTTSPTLTDDQKKIAATLSKNGIPKTAAAFLAKGSKTTGSAPANALGGVSKGSLELKKKNSILGKKPSLARSNFKKGGTIASKRSSSSSNALLNRFKKKTNTKTGNAIEIEGYAQKAEEEASINQDSSKFIFDIISYRYKSSDLFRNTVLESVKSQK